MARLYTFCRSISSQLRCPIIIHSRQQLIPVPWQVLLNPHTCCGAYSWQATASRTLHTDLTCLRQDNLSDKYSDESEFDDFSRSSGRRHRSGLSGRSALEGDDYDEVEGYSGRDDYSSRSRNSFRGRGGYHDRGEQRGYNRRGRRGIYGDDEEGYGNERRGGFDINNFQVGESPHGSINSSTLLPVKKDFFEPTASLTERSWDENQSYLRQHNIIMEGEDLPPPIQHFSDVNFPAPIVSLLQEYEAPTPIQAQGWSVALKGHDFIGVGQTGSGKTLGYILPALLHVSHHQHLLKEQNVSRPDAPLALVMAPTRELVQQIITVAEQYGRGVGVRSVAMFGGANRDRQLRNLTSNRAQLVVATPGRLLDFMTAGDVNLGMCSYAVLDEADRMLDMGFEPQIRNVLKHTRPDRHTLMWSATWPSEVQELACDFLSNPVRLSVGSTDLRANPDIQQTVHICDDREKQGMLEDLLTELLTNNPCHQALVFCQTKRTVDRVARGLDRANLSVDSIHGDKSQMARDNVLNAFRRGRCSVLVATDVAARGLDIPSLQCVVNYDFPQDGCESYIHRIGRTGRCGLKGYAHSFFTENDATHAKALVKLLQQAEQPVEERLKQMVMQGKRGPASGFGNKRGGFDRFRHGGGRGGSRGGRW